MPPAPPDPAAPQGTRCPICDATNDCGAARGSATCWCFAERVDEDVAGFAAAHGIDDRCLCRDCATGDVRSPCIDHCVLDPRGVCEGCHRTIDEIAGWSALDARGRAAVHLRIAAARRTN